MQRRTTQPSSFTPVDWSNPITLGILFCYLPGTTRDSAGRQQGVYTLNNTSVVGTSIRNVGNYSSGGLILPGSGALLGGLNQSTILGIVSPWFDINAGSGPTYIISSGKAIYSERVNASDIYKLGVTYRLFNTPQAEFTYRNDAGVLLQNWLTDPALFDQRQHMVAAVKDFGSHTTYSNSLSLTATFSGTSVFTEAVQRNIGSDNGDSNATWNGPIDLVVGWGRALSSVEIDSMRRNPWQIFMPSGKQIVLASGNSTAWISNLSGPNWVSTGSNLADVIDESVANDADYITSPILQSPTDPAIFTLTTPLVAGAYTMQVNGKTAGHGRIRVTLLDAGGASVGSSAWNSLTTTLATYTLSVTATATAYRLQLEVDNT